MIGIRQSTRTSSQNQAIVLPRKTEDVMRKDLAGGEDITGIADGGLSTSAVCDVVLLMLFPGNW